MDEVDNIILYYLRSVGCDIGHDVHGLKQFTTSMFVEAAARCIRAIDLSVDVHYRLPPSMAAQFRVGANIAAAVQNIGYRGDIGYHTFMYLNEKDIRRILLFLVDRLPKEQSELKTNSSGEMGILQKNIGEKVSGFSSTVWIPEFCKVQNQYGFSRKFSSFQLCMPHDVMHLRLTSSTEQISFIGTSLPYISMQPFCACDVSAAILETNSVQYKAHHCHYSDLDQQGLSSALSMKEPSAKKKSLLKQRIITKLGILGDHSNQDTFVSLEELASWHRDRNGSHCVKQSRFVHVQRQHFTQTSDSILSGNVNKSSHEDISDKDHKQSEKEHDSIKVFSLELASKTEHIVAETRNIVLGIQQISEQLAELSNSTEEKDKSKTIMRQAVNLLPDANANTTKLEDMIDVNSKRLLALSRQWEKHRSLLMQQFREAMHMSNKEQLTKERHMDELMWQQAKLKDLVIEAREKDAVYKQLLSEFENMVKEVNRSAYTQRIMEIVVNIRKQNQDIDKVLQDAKAIQKEINFLSGKLDRIFTVTDEIIFKDAKKDDSVRKAYKYLASLHENWSALIKTVEDTGTILKQIRDLDDQMEADDRNKILENLQQISSDYQNMLAENNALMSKLT